MTFKLPRALRITTTAAGLTLALLAGTGSVDAKPKPSVTRVRGTLYAIETDSVGGVVNIVISPSRDAPLEVRYGCGVKLSELPHVAGNIGKTIDVRVNEGGCIDRYNVSIQ